jgi:predicted SAM-dependent methyltransferase
MRGSDCLPNRSFKGVYAHHVIEHLDYEDAYRVFDEVKRVLTPAGWST